MDDGERHEEEDRATSSREPRSVTTAEPFSCS
jgi:hypothetical protein